MIGAGGQAGQNDAANLLKPALARGELRTIAATTWAEYKKYFEKDAALARRFQVVKVEEPDEEKAHRHDARPRRAAREAPQGAHPRRGGRGRRCASRTATSPAGSSPTSRSACSTRPARASRSARRRRRPPSKTRSARIDQLDVEIEALEREAATGADHEERLAELDGRKGARPRRRSRRSKAQWDKEKRAHRRRSASCAQQLEELARRRRRPRASRRKPGEGRTGDGPPRQAAPKPRRRVRPTDPATLRAELAMP